MRRALFIFLVILAVRTDAWAVADLTPGGDGVVTEVVDGDTVILETPVKGAHQVRLVGIQAPKLPLGRKGFEPWPLADESKAYLEHLVLGKHVTLAHAGQPMDRHGRLLAHVSTDDGLWIQGAILSAGMARVYSFPDYRRAVEAMLTREREARALGRGIWAHPFYAVRRPWNVFGDIGGFHVVEGRIFDAANVRGRVYLNFAADWRKDFTVSIDKKVMKLFKKLGTDPAQWKGATVRVRGWVKRRNGPMIEATHPEQIELLGRPKAEKKP